MSASPLVVRSLTVVLLAVTGLAAVTGMVACTLRLAGGDRQEADDGVELVLLSECPWCGAPIYGREVLVEGQSPLVAYSCTCHERVEELVASAIEVRERLRRRVVGR